ncbi:MAG: GNAT family N-acetyltransferase [Dehalococcoidales bacterium]|nr:MAG: GNAT family N-acetyltransferase [Dehalococcoidales bacterium]
MSKKVLRKVRYSVLLLNAGGPKVFFRHLGRQIYSRETYFGLQKALDFNCVEVPSRLEYTLRPVSQDDIKEVLSVVREESKESAHDLIQRAWFYESGFHNCYVARTTDTDQLCHIQWLVSAEADKEAIRNFGSRLPTLKDDEILIENMYTFEKYRGNYIMSSLTTRLCEMARNKGFKRALAYVRPDNTASLKGLESIGFSKFEEISEYKVLFSTQRQQK